MDDTSSNKRQLAEENLGLVPFVVFRIKDKKWSYSFTEEMLQWGYLGLVEAASRYNKEEGSFSTYACVKIRGKVLDSMRSYNKDLIRHASLSQNPGLSHRAESERRSKEIQEGEVLKMDLTLAMEVLSEEERELIRRHYFEDVTFCQMMTETGATKRQLQTIHKSALRKMEKVLSEYL